MFALEFFTFFVRFSCELKLKFIYLFLVLILLFWDLGVNLGVADLGQMECCWEMFCSFAGLVRVGEHFVVFFQMVIFW